MNIRRYIGLALIALAWLWLAWSLLSIDGVNLKNLLICAMTAIIVFVPLYKKYTGNNNQNRA